MNKLNLIIILCVGSILTACSDETNTMDNPATEKMESAVEHAEKHLDAVMFVQCIHKLFAANQAIVQFVEWT